MEKVYVQYGCGLVAPKQWINFDASPTLRIQKLTIVGNLVKNTLNTVFPPNVRYGDIVQGLPIAENTCDGVYCSHVLEHLSLVDFRKALKNTYKILKPGGTFRCVMPDLHHLAKTYISEFEIDDEASYRFLGNSSLGRKTRDRGLKNILSVVWGNSRHLWLWDIKSFKKELALIGFDQIRRCQFNDSTDEMFTYVESDGRFQNALAVECRK